MLYRIHIALPNAMKIRYSWKVREDCSFKSARNDTATVVMGISTFNTSKHPIKDGLNFVVNRYTEEISNEATLVMFPVPKNAALMRVRKTTACLA